MGRGVRQKPERLAAKLKEIRDGLGLSQGGMVKYLGLEFIGREKISQFELGTREPDLLVLKAYADGVGVLVDDLIDDDRDLPKKLLANHIRELTGKPQKRQALAPANTTTVLLQLRIKSDSADEENRLRGAVEKAYLKQYGMKRSKGGDYELVISHQNEADLDAQIYTLLWAIKVETRRRNCAIEARVREKDGDDYW